MGLFDKKHSVGKTISTLRKEKGWTQVELAEKLQVSDKAVSKWEKDDAFPSVEFFPVLAELFGVSIDYLMTGKAPEKEIIIMSKAELCAKNDDVTMLDKIQVYTKDEDGKALADYVVKYERVKVYNACKNLTIENIIDDVKMALLSNNIEKLDSLQIKKLAHISERSSYYQRSAIITDTILNLIINYPRILDITFDYLLAPIGGDERMRYDEHIDKNTVWYLMIPHLIHMCYEQEKTEKLNKLLLVAKQTNKFAAEQKKEYEKIRLHEVNFGHQYHEKLFGVIIIEKKTIDLALENGDIEMVERLNEINSIPLPIRSEGRYIADEDQIRVAKLRLDQSMSETDIAIQSAMHNGILCISELLELNDFKIIKKTLFDYPIHQFEILDKWLQEKNWSALFRFGVDCNDSELTQHIVKKQYKEVESSLLKYFQKGSINDKYYFDWNYGHRKYHFDCSEPKTCAEAMEILMRCRQYLIDELSLKMDKEKIVGELTRDYFEDLLAKGETEMLIIKLCVRLETVLRCDYHYEGDFAEMLKKYCDDKLCWSEDDGWGYMESRSDDKTIKLLNNLRIKRNSIVHSEKAEIELTMEDIRYCVEYICNMG